MTPEQFIDRLSRIASDRLPGESAHLELIPFSRPLSSKAKARSSTYRESGVGIVLYSAEVGIKCILIERPPYDGTHGGQISFPGGKRDEGDSNLEYTARRECFEEIGLPIGTGRLIFPLTEVFIPVSDFLVQPFIFFVDKLPPLTPDEREVKSIILFDLFSLLDESVLMRKSILLKNGTKLKDMPYFDIQGHVVWGATAMILSELKAILERIK